MTAPTVADFHRAFEAERSQLYPVIDAFEQRCGVALDRGRLETAARVLACPVKPNGANWQHGRVIYALVRAYVRGLGPMPVVRCLDVGTAKGFSALCLHWAVSDECGLTDSVVSLDVLDPAAQVRRNTIAEVDGYRTLAEILAPWPAATHITFLKQTGIEWLRAGTNRVHVAYVDGKHTFDVVSEEIRLLARRQQPGDVALFDDVQIEGVARALAGASKLYSFETIALNAKRAYAVGVRRG